MKECWGHISLFILNNFSRVGLLFTGMFKTLTCLHHLKWYKAENLCMYVGWDWLYPYGLILHFSHVTGCTTHCMMFYCVLLRKPSTDVRHEKAKRQKISNVFGVIHFLLKVLVRLSHYCWLVSLSVKLNNTSYDTKRPFSFNHVQSQADSHFIAEKK